MLKKIISGGQTGADQGGLWAGRKLGLDTGGTAPHGWLTDEGPSPNRLRYFGLVEGPPDESKYRKRTKLNVRDGDGTVIFGDISSPGSRLTIRYCKELLRPYIVNPTSSELALWISDNSIATLNVAGNRERTNPGVGTRTESVIKEAFRMLKEVENS